MAIHARTLSTALTALTLLGGLAAAGSTPALAQNRNSAAGGVTGPSPIRTEFTRPGGLPGSPREIGQPERFWDSVQDKKKKHTISTTN